MRRLIVSLGIVSMLVTAAPVLAPDPSLREYLEQRIDELDRRYEQRFRSQEEAIKLARDATDARLEGMNEFRDSLKDQTAAYMPRLEAEGRLAALESQLASLTARVDRREGQSSGVQMGWGWLVGIVALIGGILGIGFLFRGQRKT